MVTLHALQLENLFIEFCCYIVVVVFIAIVITIAVVVVVNGSHCLFGCSHDSTLLGQRVGERLADIRDNL